MQQKQPETPMLLFLIIKSLWLALMLLLGLISTGYVSASTTSQPNSTAETPDKLTRLKHQRKLYLLAQKSFKKGHFTTYKHLSASLKDYPLHPYLEYQGLIRQLKQHPASLSSVPINHFLQANDDTVIGSRFRLKLIKHAARIHNWQTLLDIYRPGFGTSAECHYLNALIHTGQAKLAWTKIENIWLSSRSQPNTCDPVFKQWQAAGFKTPALVWQRFKLAILASNRRLAGYLASTMQAKDAVVARKWLKVHRKPQLLTSAEIINLKHPEKPAILLHSLKRLSYRDLDATIKAWQQMDKSLFSPQQLAEISRRIGLQLARNHMPDAGLWLARIPESHASKQVKEWRIRTAIRQGDWVFVLKGIAQLNTQQQSNYRWQYWWAYANEQLGNTIDAHGIYQYLANKRSYYGFLAADHLSLPYSYEDHPVEPSEATMLMVSQQPETLRAREFYALNQTLSARREWHRLIGRMNTEQRLAASKLAQSWDWHDRAIITMGRTEYRDDIALRFPLYLESKVNDWSTRHKIEPSWTFAIMRRESAFMTDARSPVGALGLMQLMPNTARNVARQMKIHYSGSNSLLTINTNIRLGTGYLQRMLGKLDQQHVLATAAYNAGPGRVAKWLPEHRQMDAIRWIETIPFTETREYVSNVLAYMVIYEYRMNNQPTRLSQWMPPVPARNPLTVPTSKSTEQTVQTLESVNRHRKKDSS
ncbi:Soluble lytic murein transglycosylase precursor [hydrothermal vent metagenome]|uniref:Soluble lytic murein transglycosylase n=1 Tax=hydrothermal vent metagenome TaxID=652676 RepID=A0A3B0X8V8_9ZZZZ